MKIIKRVAMVALAAMALTACATDRSSRNEDQISLPTGAATGGSPSIPQLDPTVDR
jgi:hypothetical protein